MNEHEGQTTNLNLSTTNNINNNISEVDYLVLKYILEKNKKNEPFTQREISKALQISLGLTNNIIKKVIKKGFVLISHVNSKKMNYILTKNGINFLYSKSINYFKNMAKNVYYFKNIFCNMVNKLKEDNYSKIILLGDSQIDFIIEYCVIKSKLKFDYYSNSDIEKKYSDISKFEQLFNEMMHNCKKIDSQNNIKQKNSLNNINIKNNENKINNRNKMFIDNNRGNEKIFLFIGEGIYKFEYNTDFFQALKKTEIANYKLMEKLIF